MRKKLLSLCCAFLLMAGSVVAFTGEVQAEEESRPMIDGSYLIQEDESVDWIFKGGAFGTRPFLRRRQYDRFACC